MCGRSAGVFPVSVECGGREDRVVPNGYGIEYNGKCAVYYELRV